MAKPNSRQTLIDYSLRALGAPVIEINVDEDQLEDRVDEALQFYQEYHSDSMPQSNVRQANPSAPQHSPQTHFQNYPLALKRRLFDQAHPRQVPRKNNRQSAASTAPN